MDSSGKPALTFQALAALIASFGLPPALVGTAAGYNYASLLVRR